MRSPKLTSRDDAGLRKLAAAVLLQAVEDFRHGNEQARESASYWFDERHDAGLSFGLCSRILGLSPAMLRQGLGLHHGLETEAPLADVSNLELELAGVAHSAA